jgi:RNA recognition motif-containing protein
VGEYIKNKPKAKKKFNHICVKNIPRSFSDADIENFFSAYGPLESTLIKEPTENELAKLPEEKKQQILTHKYAFICFKSFDDAEKALNKLPYYKITDKAYNEQVDKVSDLLSKQSELKSE